MAFASWLCANSSKNMVVKIIYPGCWVELHDRPILAAEIMQRNPKCCVTRPDVFREPSAVVSPDTMLMLGKKYYVVPISTLRKLHRLSMTSSHSFHVQNHSSHPTPRHPHHLNSYKRRTSPPERSFGCLKQSEVELDDASLSGSSKSSASEMARRGKKLDDGCFKFLRAMSKTKPGKPATDGMRTKENGTKDIKGCQIRNAPPSTTPSYHWQPSLDSISEE